MKLFWICLALLSFPGWGISPPRAVDPKRSSDPIQKIKRLKVKNISDLSRLSPFKDVAVIQRRYLPKTFRGEVGLSLTGLLNNKFFYSGGVSGQLGFFIRERFGFGLDGMALWRAKRTVSKNLMDVNREIPFVPVNPRYYGGAWFKWNPIYGKFAFLERRIVYFDMFFLMGGGLMGLTGIDPEIKRAVDSGMEPTNKAVLDSLTKPYWPALMLGFGQIFAVNKDAGISWALRFIGYRFDLTGPSGRQSSSQVDIHFFFGVNYYFPGAKYR